MAYTYNTCVPLFYNNVTTFYNKKFKDYFSLNFNDKNA